MSHRELPLHLAPVRDFGGAEKHRKLLSYLTSNHCTQLGKTRFLQLWSLLIIIKKSEKLMTLAKIGIFISCYYFRIMHNENAFTQPYNSITNNVFWGNAT